jgi:hypothetical protein
MLSEEVVKQRLKSKKHVLFKLHRAYLDILIRIPLVYFLNQIFFTEIKYSWFAIAKSAK